MLRKALDKFPPGTSKRWEQVQAYVRTRTVEEVSPAALRCAALLLLNLLCRACAAVTCSTCCRALRSQLAPSPPAVASTLVHRPCISGRRC